MKNKSLSGSSWRRALTIASAFVLCSQGALLAQQYQENDLVSDTLTENGNPPDPSLKNPWGIARGTGGPWWVSDNAGGVSTLYNGSGIKQGLTVNIPHTAQTMAGSPTGIVFNGSSDFAVSTGNPAIFIFASFDGTISGWNPGVDLHNAIPKVTGSADSILTGATIAQIGTKRYLYVADIRKGEITVYDTAFTAVELSEHAFHKDHVPKGFTPFNVQNIGNNLYVTYAKQNKTKTFVTFGNGLGYVDVFSPDGEFLMQLEHNDSLNAPWGLTLAPSDFGSFSRRVIVGEFGSGWISAFDAVTGEFIDNFKNSTNGILTIVGPGALWALQFGDGEKNSDPLNQPANALFFTAGPFANGVFHGLFGTVTPLDSDLIQGSDQ
ncbi:MAG: TIGR03118 family protein [Verrucomicrobia bacterium]|nr:TIGR03118 family protein [Verrucomicrobiota bacterium]